ncbi:hypothetical protein Esti_005886 [Eimeria stiedai]
MERLSASLKAASVRIARGYSRATHRFLWFASKATRRPKPSVARWAPRFPSQHELRHAPHVKLLAVPAGIRYGLKSRSLAKNGFSLTCRRHLLRCPPDSVKGSSALPETIGEDLTSEMNSEGTVDLHQAKEELLASLESVRTSADGGSVYVLKSVRILDKTSLKLQSLHYNLKHVFFERLSKALPQSSAAASMAADVGRLVNELSKLKQEKAALMAFRHQTPREIRKEYTQMMLIGLATGLAAAIHPVFFAGIIYGVVCMRQARLAETDRDAGTSRLEEVVRLMKQNKADLDALLDKLAVMMLIASLWVNY